MSNELSVVYQDGLIIFGALMLLIALGALALFGMRWLKSR